MSQAYTLASNVSSNAAQSPVTVMPGGRMAAVVSGTLATSTVIQMLLRDGVSYTTVQTIAAAGLQSVLYLPPGSYRLFQSGSAGVNVYVDLYSV